MKLQKLCCVSFRPASLLSASAWRRKTPWPRTNNSFRGWSTAPAPTPSGIPFADGYADYLDMINARDGGVGGVKITYEECETNYNNDKGVECYERLKNHAPTGATVVDPLSTGITYALIEKRHRGQDPDSEHGLWPR